MGTGSLRRETAFNRNRRTTTATNPIANAKSKVMIFEQFADIVNGAGPSMPDYLNDTDKSIRQLKEAELSD